MSHTSSMCAQSCSVKTHTPTFETSCTTHFFLFLSHLPHLLFDSQLSLSGSVLSKLQFCFAFFVLFCFALVFAACLFLTSMAGCLWQGIGQSVPGLCLPLPSCLTVTGVERPCHSWSCLPQRSTAKDASLIFVLIFHWHTPQTLCVSLYGDIHASEAPPHRPISREPGVWKSKWLFRPERGAQERQRRR